MLSIEMTGFVELLTAAQTRWDAAALLLTTWNARPSDLRPERRSDEFLETVDRVRAHFDDNPDALELSDADRSQILAWTQAGTDVHGVDAVGFGLNLSSSAGFAQSWREKLPDRHRPAVGEIYPAADAPWPPAFGPARRTPSPRSMNVDANDHPHARTVRDGMLPVEFDFSLWRALRQIGLQLDTIAAITANDDLGELGLEPPPPSAFPVRPIDEEQQTDRVLRQLDNAIEAGAKIIVLPELSTTPELMRRIQRRLDHDDEQRLVICGSWHQADPADGQPANLSLGLVSGLPAKMRHRKIVEFGDLYPSVPSNRRREGIEAPASPLLRIYVADQFRFALVICKDFLDASVTQTLDRIGANVLLVPALSRTTQPFKSRAHAHVSDSQAVSIIANGPRTWSGTPITPTALVTRPYEPGDILEGVADPAPSTLLFSLRAATVAPL